MNNPNIVIQVNDPQGQPALLWVRLVARPGGLTVRIGQLVNQPHEDGYPVARLVNPIGMHGSFVHRLRQVDSTGEFQWNEFELALVCQRYFHEVSVKKSVAGGALNIASVKATGRFWRR